LYPLKAHDIQHYSKVARRVPFGISPWSLINLKCWTMYLTCDSLLKMVVLKKLSTHFKLFLIEQTDAWKKKILCQHRVNQFINVRMMVFCTKQSLFIGRMIKLGPLQIILLHFISLISLVISMLYLLLVPFNKKVPIHLHYYTSSHFLFYHFINIPTNIFSQNPHFYLHTIVRYMPI
jgi:hypothetical protein